MKKILWFGDGAVPTGFAKVNHSIIENLPEGEFDIHHVAINYYGDPHEHKWKLYPAAAKGDLYGFGRIPEFAEKDFDGIFILNDPWMIDRYLTEIRKHWKKIPPIIVYFPVDSEQLSEGWFGSYDLVSAAVTYTKFGESQVPPSIKNLHVIPHGVDTGTFFKTHDNIVEAKKLIFGDKDDFINSFIILSAQRNQPRKRLDITMEAFSLFAKDKPENVKLYLHCGTKDAGWDLFDMAAKLRIDKRLIITSKNRNIAAIPVSRLNAVYNASDVGINTSLGEGWSLTNHEHAATGAPQIVPQHSALTELYQGCGYLVESKYHQYNVDTHTLSRIVTPEDVASAMELAYTNKELREYLAYQSYNKFSSETYQWKNIVEKRWLPLFREVF